MLTRKGLLDLLKANGFKAEATLENVKSFVKSLASEGVEIAAEDGTAIDVDAIWSAKSVLKLTGTVDADDTDSADDAADAKAWRKSQAKAVKGKGPDSGHADAAAIKPVTIQDPRTGKTVQAVSRTALVAAGVKGAALPKAAANHNDAYKQQQADWARRRKEQEAKEEAERAARLQVLDAVMAQAAKRERTAFDLQLIVRAAWSGVDWNDRAPLAQRWGFTLPKHEENFDPPFVESDVDTLARFAMECALFGCVDNVDQAALLAAAKHYGVNVGAERAKAVTPATATPAPKGRKGKTAIATTDDDAEPADEADLEDADA